MDVTRDEILTALKVVQDPDLKRDLVSLGFIKNVTVQDGRVAVTIELTTPACPVRDLMKEQAREAIQALPGVTQVIERALKNSERILLHRVVADPLYAESRSGQQGSQGPRREVIEMAREVEMKPRPACPSRLEAVDVRHRNNQTGPRFQSPPRLRERSQGIMQVLEHVPVYAKVESAGWQACLGKIPTMNCHTGHGSTRRAREPVRSV